MTTHTASRLSETDHATIRSAVQQYANEHPGSAVDELRRFGAGSIGCTLPSLRDVEVEWLDEVAVAAQRTALRRHARQEDESIIPVDPSVDLSPLADPGCYGCLGTGRIVWAHCTSVPCSCVVPAYR